jgi:hypothetical protein
MAGTIKLNEVAANITPAAPPSMVSIIRSEIRRTNNAGKAPTPVAKPAAKLASNPRTITLSNIITPNKLESINTLQKYNKERIQCQ